MTRKEMSNSHGKEVSLRLYRHRVTSSADVTDFVYGSQEQYNFGDHSSFLLSICSYFKNH